MRKRRKPRRGERISTGAAPGLKILSPLRGFSFSYDCPAGRRPSGENCDGDGTFNRNIGAMSFDALKLVQSFGGEVTRAAVGARDDRNILNHKQAGSFAVASCDMADACAVFTANIANHQIILLFFTRHTR